MGSETRHERARCGDVPERIGRPLRTALLVVGVVSVALAVLGIFLPLLPTTPFLLLAAFCFARSSQRFYRWLLTNRWFGAYICNYRAGKGIPLKQKLITLVVLWLTIGYTAVFAVSHCWLRLLLVAIALGVTVHLARIRTYRPEARDAREFEFSGENGV